MKCFEYHKLILQFKLYGFVIMPDHVHLVIQPPAEITISKIMNYIKGNFSRKYNWVNGAAGHVWQKRFYGKGIRGVMQLTNLLDYIHYNPVRAGLVVSPGDYEFSSYRHYYGASYHDLIDSLL